MREDTRMAQVKDGNEQPSLVERAAEKLRGSAGKFSLAAPRHASLTGAPGPGSAEQADTPQHGPQRTSRRAEVDPKRMHAAGIFTADSGFTYITEEFRLIKRSVLLAVSAHREQGSKNSNLIMVTSSREGEGKTFVALNLAVSIAAERDWTVLLVDADLSNPSLLSQLGLHAGKGLVDVLEDATIDVAEVLIRTNVEGLSVLPAGHPHPFSTELLASTRMTRIMAELSERYPDRVIILDAPPVLATSEPSTLAMHIGQIVFVVQARRTSRAAVQEALNLIGICPNIGFVLNKTPFQFGSTRFGSYYKSYRKYYKSYRKTRR